MYSCILYLVYELQFVVAIKIRIKKKQKTKKRREYCNVLGIIWVGWSGFYFSGSFVHYWLLAMFKSFHSITFCFKNVEKS